MFSIHSSPEEMHWKVSKKLDVDTMYLSRDKSLKQNKNHEQTKLLLFSGPVASCRMRQTII